MLLACCLGNGSDVNLLLSYGSDVSFLFSCYFVPGDGEQITLLFRLWKGCQLVV